MTITSDLHSPAGTLPAEPVAAGVLIPIHFEIPLTGGGVALVDAEDYALVQGYTWRRHVRSRSNRKTYARTQVRVGNGRRVWVWMHRLIMGVESVRVVDHEDSNGLNNRRKNLRVARTKQNACNKRVIRAGSGFKGVSSVGKKFAARITLNGKTLSLGTFPTAEAASNAYDRAARKLHGKFAATNAEILQWVAA